MWRWQPSEHNRLWRHIITSCALIHAILLCVLFLVYRGTVDNYLIYTSSVLTTQQVILLPLHKVIGAQATTQMPQITKKSAASATQSIDTHSEVVERKTPVHEPKATTLISSKKKIDKKERKKKSKKKSKKSVREKKNAKQKKEKEAAKPEVKKIEEKKVEEQKLSEKPVLTGDTAVAMTMPADTQSAIYVGQLEYEALQLQEAMQQELQQHWKPPIGHAGLTCVMRIILDWQGAISDVIIEQPSGVLLFDMSAEQAIYVMTFPKTAWGKQVTITFS